MKTFLSVYLISTGVLMILMSPGWAIIGHAAANPGNSMPLNSNEFGGISLLISGIGLVAVLAGALLAYLAAKESQKPRGGVPTDCNATNWFAFVNDQIEGPFTFSSLIEQFKERRLKGDTRVRAEGKEAWCDLADLPGVNAGEKTSLAPSERDNLLAIAEAQRSLMSGYLGGAVIQLFAFLPALLPGNAFTGPASLMISQIGLVWLALHVQQLAIALKKPSLIWLVITFVPCAGLIAVLILSSTASSELAKHGIRVGLMGATPQDVINATTASQASE